MPVIFVNPIIDGHQKVKDNMNVRMPAEELDPVFHIGIYIYIEAIYLFVNLKTYM